MGLLCFPHHLGIRNKVPILETSLLSKEERHIFNCNNPRASQNREFNRPDIQSVLHTCLCLLVCDFAICRDYQGLKEGFIRLDCVLIERGQFNSIVKALALLYRYKSKFLLVYLLHFDVYSHDTRYWKNGYGLKLRQNFSFK